MSVLIIPFRLLKNLWKISESVFFILHTCWIEENTPIVYRRNCLFGFLYRRRVLFMRTHTLHKINLPMESGTSLKRGFFNRPVWHGMNSQLCMYICKTHVYTCVGMNNYSSTWWLPSNFSFSPSFAQFNISCGSELNTSTTNILPIVMTFSYESCGRPTKMMKWLGAIWALFFRCTCLAMICNNSLHISPIR